MSKRLRGDPAHVSGGTKEIAARAGRLVRPLGHRQVGKEKEKAKHFMKRALVRIGAAAALVATPIPATSAGAQGLGDADLSVTMTWIGHGTPRVRVGAIATFAVEVTNLGPDTAVGALLGTDEADQLNLISLTCSDPSLCPAPGEPSGSGADLAPGATVTGKLVWMVCCFPKGGSRKPDVNASIGASTADPNHDNNGVTQVIKIVGPHGFASLADLSLVDLIDTGDRGLIRGWAAENSIADINEAVVSLEEVHRNRLAEVLLDSNATEDTRDRLLSIMRLALAQPDLGFYAEIWSYTRIEMTPGGFFGTCRFVFLDPSAYASLLDIDARNVLLHESFHSFNCVNGGPAGSLNEGSAIWVFKAGFPGPLTPGESWAEATYGTKLFFRDILGVPDLPLEAPPNPTQKLIDVYEWLSDNDPSQLPWNSTERLVTCFERYFERLHRDVDFVTVWLPAVHEATEKMLADPECKPV